MDMGFVGEFLSKASPKVVNGVVLTLGIILIIFVGISSYIVLKKVINSFVREENYSELQASYIEMSNAYRTVIDMYYRATNITSISTQLFHDISVLVYRDSQGEDIKEAVSNMISAIIFTIPHLIKSTGGENHRCFLWIKDSVVDNHLINIASSTNNIQTEGLSINNSFAGRVFSSGKERYSPNINDEIDFEKRNSSNLRYTSLAGVPIKWENEVVGVLTIDAKREDAFTQDDIDNLSIYGAMLSMLV